MNDSPVRHLDADTVLFALTRVLDPEFEVNIVDLGLIYDVTVTDASITITMTLTTVHCPAGQVIVDGVRAAAAAQCAERDVDVRVVWDPAWRPEMLSGAAREQLGWAPADD
jgi:metal-sulfur cluster biosynthetic enzyme